MMFRKQCYRKPNRHKEKESFNIGFVHYLSPCLSTHDLYLDLPEYGDTDMGVMF